MAEKQFVAVNTQRTALNALVFMCRRFLGVEMKDLAFTYSKSQRRPPNVFTHQEAMAVIDEIPDEPYRLMVKLLYGSGLRVNECLRLRVKDLDFGHLQIVVRSGKGEKDRTTLLPEELVAGLKEQVLLHQYDSERGYGEVYMPDALARKYPIAAKGLASRGICLGCDDGAELF